MRFYATLGYFYRCSPVDLYAAPPDLLAAMVAVLDEHQGKE